jgi:hypothetical protein
MFHFPVDVRPSSVRASPCLHWRAIVPGSYASPSRISTPRVRALSVANDLKGAPSASLLPMAPTPRLHSLLRRGSIVLGETLYPNIRSRYLAAAGLRQGTRGFSGRSP